MVTTPPTEYFVVELWNSPRPDVDKWICVPHTWLKWIEGLEPRACVAYPEGSPAEVEELARKNKSDPADWSTHIATIEFFTNSYDEAMIYVNYMRELKFPNENRTPVKQLKFSEVQSAPRPIAWTSNSSGIRLRANIFEQTASPASLSNTKDPVHNCQHPGTSSNHACCATKYVDALGSIQTNIQNLVTEFSQWTRVNTKNSEKLSELEAWMKDYHLWKRSVTTQMNEISRKVKGEVIVIKDSDDNTGVANNANDADIYADDDVNRRNSLLITQIMNVEKPEKVHQRKVAQFTLPPEYKQNDSRWTLRHPYPSSRLRELTPNSRIYVNSSKVSYSLLHAKDCTSLSRFLMLEIFSDNALKVCSLTGAKCPLYHYDSPVRPGLDQNGRNVLIRYVQEIGRQKGWYISDVKTIKQTLRAKLERYRQKANNRN